VRPHIEMSGRASYFESESVSEMENTPTLSRRLVNVQGRGGLYTSPSHRIVACLPSSESRELSRLAESGAWTLRNSSTYSRRVR